MGLFDNLFKQAENLVKKEVNSAASSAASAAAKAASAAKTKTVTLSALPQNVAEMKQMPEFSQNDPFTVAAFTVAAFYRYAASREDGKEMVNFLKGPEPLSNREMQFINDRFMDGKDYVTRSYFTGTSPEND